MPRFQHILPKEDQPYMKHYDNFALRLVIRFKGERFNASQAYSIFRICCVPEEKVATVRSWMNILLNQYLTKGLLKSLGHNNFRTTKKLLLLCEDELIDKEAELNGASV